MQSSEPIIYVAGNPELYPLEYYDSDSQSYQGAIPGFLERFAQETKIGDVAMEINDNNGTPFVVSLRLKQAWQEGRGGERS